MENLISLLYKFTGSVYIPSDISRLYEDLIIHISDTPISFFSALTKILKKLKPKYIIHTGDMVDNLKIQLSPSFLPRYEKDLKWIMSILENSSAEKIYITPGNHDNPDMMRKFSKRSIILEHSANINIEGLDLRVSHYSTEIQKDPQKFNLYGHDLSLKSMENNNKFYLNGIMSINIISVNSSKIFKLPYPFGTDDMRLKRGKIGL